MSTGGRPAAAPGNLARNPFASSGNGGGALPGLAGFNNMRTVQPPPQNAPASLMPSWTPEPERAPAPPPQPSYPQEPARPTYEEMVERERRAALNRGPQEPRPFEPELQEPEIDPFAADELQRYLANEAEEPEQAFGDQPYELQPAAFEEAEDASFETQDAFDGEDAFDATEPFDAQEAFETDAEPQLFPAEEEPAAAAFDAEFSAYSDLDDEEEERTPSYGDAFGHEPQPQDLDADSGAGSRQMKPFEARYDQHPEIALGEYPQQPQQDGDASFEEAFFAGDQGDAELGDAEAEGKPRGRRKMMLAASLVGALAIGGALAYFYKGDSLGVAGSGEPPLITADQRPVKTTPTDPGGKTFPHKNKLIYDRLQGEEPAEQERLVSRQEDVASAGSGQTDAAQPESAGGQQVASANQTASDAQAGVEPAASRRVRTFVVLPDGSVVKPEDNNQAPAAAAAAPQAEVPSQPASIPGLAVANAPARPAAQPAAAAAPSEPAPAAEAQQPAAQPQQQFASVQSPSAPVAPVRKPSPPPVQQQAAVQPAPARPAPQTTASTSSGGSFVVQVAARKSQTDALAAFADLQQRYPQLLSGYRPIIERADLGAKGVWYRLRVGPMETKTVASNLCGKLQAAGMKECLIYSQ